MMIRCMLPLILLFVLAIPAVPQSGIMLTHASYEPTTSSVLSGGTWFKFKLNSTGIYRLTYDDLKNMGFTNPAGIRLFGNGGTMLPLTNAEARYDDLIENRIYMNTGSDGVFNQGDYILFYGRGPVTWSYNSSTDLFEHEMHLFSNAAYYFITDQAGSGLKITDMETVGGTPSVQVTTFDRYACHEKNRVNLLESGRLWFGERIDYSDYDTTIMFTGLETTTPLKIKVNVVSRSENTKVFTLASDAQTIGTITTGSVDLDNKTGAYATQKSGLFNYTAASDEVNLNLSYNKTSGDDEGYLDYLIVNAKCTLSQEEDALFFRNKDISGTEAIAQFVIENCTAETEIWDITDPFNIARIASQLNGTTLTFTDSTNTLKEYVALNPGASFPKPTISTSNTDVGIISNQNLHGISAQQMLIITNPLFISAADSLAAFHRKKDNLSVYVVTTTQVFNEFSSGMPDVSAIRDFARMVYNRSTGQSDQLKYLLLLGDGSYNNISTVSGNANYILTYQSDNSLNASYSYVSDDFFGLMEDDEGGTEIMENYSLDIGVGRLPVKTAEEAMNMYKKISNYNTANNMGDWRNNILFLADDEDANLHMIQANELADWVDTNYPQFNIKKVLIDAYKQVTSTTGERYPDVNTIVCNSIEKGLLIFNYTGHGGEIGLADEHILMSDELESLSNSGKLPLFVTATCEFSRFDDITDDESTISESTSAGEYSLLNPNGGSIALLTTTRIVYSSDNHQLNSRFYQYVFDKDANGDYYRLGDVIRLTKNASGFARNKLNFILLGDPALQLAIPNYTVVTDSLNQVSVNEPIDTLKAFSRIHISGHLADEGMNLIDSFNGIIYPSVYDKKKTVTTLGNDDYDPLEFTTQENLLYKGKASVTNGRFSLEFIVPKDITYSYGNGKITYYSHNSNTDANGQFADFIIGGTDLETTQDVTGPDIELYLNDEYFNNQGITNHNPVIYALINDESGINTIGNGIGHDITGIIDDNVTDPVVMNEYFEANLDDFTSGILSYPMEDLEEGWHSLRVKVWDVFNNSSEETIEFRVISGISIANAGNYPNPASDYTNFIFEHNKPGEEITVTITVYDMQGRMITRFSENLETSGFSSTPLLWNLRDANGNRLRQGIYPYSIRIADASGAYSESFQKLVVIKQ